MNLEPRKPSPLCENCGKPIKHDLYRLSFQTEAPNETVWDILLCVNCGEDVTLQLKRMTKSHLN